MSTLILAACLVIGVSDGDSIRVKCPERTAAFAVRLAGVDAPEIAHKAFGIAEQPWGRESKASLTALCLKKTADVKRIAFDRYRRAVGFVQCEGRDASVHQIATGNAWVFLPPKKQAAAFKSLQERAKAARLGLWAGEPIEPSLWRKRQ